MKNLLMLSAVVMLLCGPAVADMVNFNSAGDISKFQVFGATVQNPITFGQITPSTDSNGGGAGMAQLAVYNQYQDQASGVVYAPTGTPLVAGVGTYSADVALSALSDGNIGFNTNLCYYAGIMLPSVSGSGVVYSVGLEYNYDPGNDNMGLTIGATDGTRYLRNIGGHTDLAYVYPLGLSGSTFYNLTAVVSNVGGKYDIVATLKALDGPGGTPGTTIASTEWTDTTGHAVPTTGVVGFHATSYNWGDPPDNKFAVIGGFDNFSEPVLTSTPEPATMAFLLLGGLSMAGAGLKRRFGRKA
jgi:hypothetical protein